MAEQQLLQLIKNDDAQAASNLLKQNIGLLNQYCVPDPELELWWTPLGYAAYYNKLKCVDAISSLPGVDLSKGIPRYGPLFYAIYEGHTEAAKILAKKGAECTEKEKEYLGEKYTNFQLTLQVATPESAEKKEERKCMEELNKQRPRGAIRYWMKNNEFEKLQEWLGKSRNQLEGLFASGDVPVVGWLQLAEKIKSKEACKRKLEGELDENARENQEIQQQINKLQEKQEELAKKKEELDHQLKMMEKIDVLEAESNTIAMLGKKEEESLAIVEDKMKNDYFMGDLDFRDTSTLFSMFDMDSLFARFSDNEPSKSIEVALLTPLADLENIWQLELEEAAEMLFKMNLIEKGEKGVEGHLRKCSICRSKNPAVLLGEYGMKEEERKEIGEKIKNWPGYFLVAVPPAPVASALGLPPALKSKLTICLSKMQKLHDWDSK